MMLAPRWWIQQISLRAVPYVLAGESEATAIMLAIAELSKFLADGPSDAAVRYVAKGVQS